jgi:hypothetical protein
MSVKRTPATPPKNNHAPGTPRRGAPAPAPVQAAAIDEVDDGPGDDESEAEDPSDLDNETADDLPSLSGALDVGGEERVPARLPPAPPPAHTTGISASGTYRLRVSMRIDDRFLRPGDTIRLTDRKDAKRLIAEGAVVAL